MIWTSSGNYIMHIQDDNKLLPLKRLGELNKDGYLDYYRA
jgi:hypothetical protein